jgi:hypothetical protein
VQALWFKVVLGERAGDQTAIMNMSTYFDCWEVVCASFAVRSSTGKYFAQACGAK